MSSTPLDAVSTTPQLGELLRSTTVRASTDSDQAEAADFRDLLQTPSSSPAEERPVARQTDPASSETASEPAENASDALTQDSDATEAPPQDEAVDDSEAASIDESTLTNTDVEPAAEATSSDADAVVVEERSDEGQQAALSTAETSESSEAVDSAATTLEAESAPGVAPGVSDQTDGEQTSAEAIDDPAGHRDADHGNRSLPPGELDAAAGSATATEEASAQQELEAATGSATASEEITTQQEVGAAATADEAQAEDSPVKSTEHSRDAKESKPRPLVAAQNIGNQLASRVEPSSDRDASPPIGQAPAEAREVSALEANPESATKPPSLREQLVPAKPTGSDGQLRPAETSRFVQRVTRAFASIGNRSGEVRLRLSPPELGSLKISLRVENGALAARVEADTSMARNALMDNLPLLRDRLAEQGVRVEQFQVDVSDGQPEQTEEQGQRNRQQRSATPETAEDDEQSDAKVDLLKDDQLNVVV